MNFLLTLKSGGDNLSKVKRKYYALDMENCEIEVFDRNGNHIYVLNLELNYVKPRVLGRSINL